MHLAQIIPAVVAELADAETRSVLASNSTVYIYVPVRTFTYICVHLKRERRYHYVYTVVQ
jgi:hypothetical protein